jgi:RNA polymerase sigma-70 factor, ECF subfamily
MMGPPTAAATLDVVDPESIATDFPALFRREFDYVWNTLRRLGVRECDVEDLTHDVFVLVHRQIGTYDTTRPIRPWLFGIARRVAADYRRLARHKTVLAGDPGNFDSSERRQARYDAETESREAVAIVNRALATIDFDQRVVFILHDLDGYPIREVADALGICENTAFSRLRLARARFTAAVRRMDWEGSRR